ncbi:MAG: exodeoxyribonuclease VII large subunit [Bacillota bacterium]|nr:exodeoxyribonuclease VII large subunit [Bacillota bacterium]
MNEAGIYTVSQVSLYLKSLLLNDTLLKDLYVIGEISNFKLHKPSGHMYFTLKDNESLIRCVFFRRGNKDLKFAPFEGMKVIARGNLSLYERSGYYQLYIEELRPEGIGTLFLAYEQLKEKLQKEGLFAEENKKPLPVIPRCVGLVTSSSGAAVKDFLTTLRRRFPCLRVIICSTAVQGREAPPQIIEALKKLDKIEDIDIIVLTRGGGSLEELWSFNDEELARTIFKMETPVVSAVGHEIDFTIADFVADKRASTPTAAAEIIVPEKKDLLKHLGMQEYRLKNRLKSQLKEKNMNLENLSRAAALYYTREKINYGNQRTDEIWQRLVRNLFYSLKLKGSGLNNLGEKLQALSPLKIMGRGYTFVLNNKDLLVGSVGTLKEKEIVKVVFHDGEADCEVKRIQKKELFDH